MDSETNFDTGEDAPDASEDGEEVHGRIGQRLRAAREARRLDLSHIAAETRIPVRHLETIEDGDFHNLPSRTYAIGFARTYARAVGLDEGEVASAVREELADGQMRQSAMRGGMEPGDPAKLPSSGLAWAGGIGALLLAIGLIAFYNTYFGAGADPAPLIAEGDEPGAEPAAGATQGAGATADAPASADGSQPAASTGGQVVFTATGEGAWVRFYEEGGERLFEGVMEAGDTYEVPASAQDPRLNTGRPNLLAITIGGRSVPPLTEDMVPVSDAPVSAAALLARSEVPAAPAGASPSSGN